MYRIKANDKKHKKLNGNSNNAKNQNIVNNVINIIKERGFKYIDISHMEIPDLFKFTSIDLIDQTNVIAIFKNFKQSDNTKLSFNINTGHRANNNITLYHMYDYLTIPLETITDHKINKWLDDTIISGSKLLYTCGICCEDTDTTSKCPECFNDICDKCIMNNYEKNKSKLCPYCKTHNFNVSTINIDNLSFEDLLIARKDQISFL